MAVWLQKWQSLISLAFLFLLLLPTKRNKTKQKEKKERKKPAKEHSPHLEQDSPPTWSLWGNLQHAKGSLPPSFPLDSSLGRGPSEPEEPILKKSHPWGCGMVGIGRTGGNVKGYGGGVCECMGLLVGHC